jgi:hypothetical protein
MPFLLPPPATWWTIPIVVSRPQIDQKVASEILVPLTRIANEIGVAGRTVCSGMKTNTPEPLRRDRARTDLSQLDNRISCLCRC